jgi:predicted amidohydrolase YtcJ
MMDVSRLAQVFTAECDHPDAEAVAIRGDRIIAVGALGDGVAVVFTMFGGKIVYGREP